MGHASSSTTDKYVKAAESFGAAAIGEPFPSLPKAILAEVGQGLAQKCENPRLSPRVLSCAGRI